MGQRTWATLLSFVIIATIVIFNHSTSSQKVLLASNFALYDQLKHLAPKDQKVSILVPFGQDTHTFQATPKNVAMIMDATAFFYTSKGMDQWVSKLDVLKDAKNAFDLSSSIKWIEDEHHHDEDEHNEDYAFDPHYWLDLDNQIAVTHAVADKLTELFPHEKMAIKQRLETYLLALEQLKKNYKKRLTHCQKEKLFVTHDAFAYLEQKSYFSVESVVGLAPQSQPNPARMQEIIKMLQKSDVKTIFFESFISDKIVTAIANEVGIKVDVLDTLATISASQAKQSKTYSDLMQENLQKFAKALECR